MPNEATLKDLLDCKNKLDADIFMLIRVFEQAHSGANVERVELFHAHFVGEVAQRDSQHNLAMPKRTICVQCEVKL